MWPSVNMAVFAATQQSSLHYFLKVWPVRLEDSILDRTCVNFCNWNRHATSLWPESSSQLPVSVSYWTASRLRSHVSHLLRISSNDVRCGRRRKPNGEAQRFQWTAQALVYRKGYETCGFIALVHEYEALSVRKSSLYVCVFFSLLVLNLKRLV